MKLEYIGKILPDGHLSVNPTVAEKIKKGQKLKIKIEIYQEEYMPKKSLSKEAMDFLNLLKQNVHTGGYDQEKITREFIHEHAL